MTTTVFTDYVTPIPASWLNDVNNQTYMSRSTANRPASPLYGQIGFNTDTNQWEGWNGSIWATIGGGATGAPGNAAFIENDAFISGSYIIGSNSLVSGVGISNASPCVCILTGHGFIQDSQVMFETTGTLPSPLLPDTGYWVLSTGLTTSAFQISATQGGAAINTTTVGSGVHSVGKIRNAVSAGTQTIGNSATVTIPTGSTWVIVG
jgi:hypothetical protein